MIKPPSWWPWRWTVDWTCHPRLAHLGVHTYWTAGGARRAIRSKG